MIEENNKPSHENESENPSNINELTEQEFEQIAGGITPIPIPDGKFDKWRGNLTQVKLNPTDLKGAIQGGSQQ